MRLILLLISIGLGNSIVDNWINKQLDLLKISPLMITGELSSQIPAHCVDHLARPRVA